MVEMLNKLNALNMNFKLIGVLTVTLVLIKGVLGIYKDTIAKGYKKKIATVVFHSILPIFLFWIAIQAQLPAVVAGLTAAIYPALRRY